MDSKSTPTPAAVSIASGNHRDASFTIGHDDLLVIGADQTCDIRLSDPGLAPRHAALALQGGSISIRRLDGSVSINGNLLGPSERAHLPAGSAAVLGESGVRLQVSGSTPEQAPLSESEQSAAPQRAHRVLGKKLLIGLVVATVIAGIAGQRLQASRAAPVDATDIAKVQAVLQRLQLERVVSLSATSSGVVMRGVISAEAEAKLRGAIAKLRTPIVDSMLRDTELVEQVRAVFRTNGYEAEVSYLGSRRVRIENLDENNERVRDAAAHVRADVTELESLSFAPLRNAPPGKPELYGDGPGAQMRAIVDDDTAYLATADGSRYFVGSVLPTGDTVRRITETGVQVDKDGRITWLKF